MMLYPKVSLTLLDLCFARKLDLDTHIDALYDESRKDGLDIVFSSLFTTTERFLELPRKCEMKAVVNRMRRIRMEREFFKL